MNGCNVRLLSYISAGVNMVVLTSMTVAMIVLMVLRQDKSRKEENEKSGIAYISFELLIYIMATGIAGFGCSIILLQGIRLNRYKYIYFYFHPVGLLGIFWGFITLHILFGNLRAKKEVATIVLQSALCGIFIIFECILLVPVFNLYCQIKPRPIPAQQQTTSVI